MPSDVIPPRKLPRRKFLTDEQVAAKVAEMKRRYAKGDDIWSGTRLQGNDATDWIHCQHEIQEGIIREDELEFEEPDFFLG